MLTPDEIEAVVLGAQWVAGRADPVMANAARDLVAKIAFAVPEHLRPYIDEPSVGAKPGGETPAERISTVRSGRQSARD
jgi:predicted DNA-binding transcriptional regulator YafY